jgi:hypothetical protein
MKENKAMKKTTSLFNDPEELNVRMDAFIKKFDEIN